MLVGWTWAKLLRSFSTFWCSCVGSVSNVNMKAHQQCSKVHIKMLDLNCGSCVGDFWPFTDVFYLCWLVLLQQLNVVICRVKISCCSIKVRGCGVGGDDWFCQMVSTTFPLQFVCYTLMYYRQDALVEETGGGETFLLLKHGLVVVKRPEKGAEDLTVGSWLENVGWH